MRSSLLASAGRSGWLAWLVRVGGPYQVAVVLGVVAFGCDYVGGVLGAGLVALASSGVAWGGYAYLVGYVVPERRPWLVAVVGLVVATGVYYLLVLLVSQRWRGGVLEDGSPAYRLGLSSVARAFGLWIVVSLVAGAVLGPLGRATRIGAAVPASVCCGVAFGALSAQGWYQLAFSRAWRAPDDFGVAILVSAVAIISTAAVIAIAVALARRPPLRWSVLAGTGVAASGLGLLGWRLVDGARVVLGV